MGRQFLSWNIIFSNTEHQHVSQGWRLFENFAVGTCASPRHRRLYFSKFPRTFHLPIVGRRSLRRLSDGDGRRSAAGVRLETGTGTATAWHAHLAVFERLRQRRQQPDSPGARSDLRRGAACAASAYCSPRVQGR